MDELPASSSTPSRAQQTDWPSDHLTVAEVALATGKSQNTIYKRLRNPGIRGAVKVVTPTGESWAIPEAEAFRIWPSVGPGSKAAQQAADVVREELEEVKRELADAKKEIAHNNEIIEVLKASIEDLRTSNRALTAGSAQTASEGFQGPVEVKHHRVFRWRNKPSQNAV